MSALVALYTVLLYAIGAALLSAASVCLMLFVSHLMTRRRS